MFVLLNQIAAESVYLFSQTLATNCSGATKCAITDVPMISNGHILCKGDHYNEDPL